MRRTRTSTRGPLTPASHPLPRPSWASGGAAMGFAKGTLPAWKPTQDLVDYVLQQLPHLRP